MVELPSNVTLAALALVLGAVLGAGGYHFLSPSEEPEASLEGLPDGPGVLERNLDRQLQPSDTSDQEDEPELKVRYKRDTTTVVDSVYVPIPSTFSQPKLSTATPISVSEDRVTWTYWDPAVSGFRQQVYAVPHDNFFVRAHVMARTHAPLTDVSLGLSRTWAGVGLSARWRRVTASVSALTTPDLGRQRVVFGLRWRLGSL